MHFKIIVRCLAAHMLVFCLFQTICSYVLTRNCIAIVLMYMCQLYNHLRIPWQPACSVESALWERKMHKCSCGVGAVVLVTRPGHL